MVSRPFKSLTDGRIEIIAHIFQNTGTILKLNLILAKLNKRPGVANRKGIATA